MITNRDLTGIREKLLKKLPGLRNKHFSLWDSYEKGLQLQCFERSNGQVEYYGHIFNVVDIEEGVLTIA